MVSPITPDELRWGQAPVCALDPNPFHLLCNNNLPLSLLQHPFFPSLRTFPLVLKHAINPSKKIKTYLDPLCSLQVPLLFSFFITHTHRNYLKQLSTLTVSRSLPLPLSNPAAASLSSPPLHWNCSCQVNKDHVMPNSSPNLTWQQRLEILSWKYCHHLASRTQHPPGFSPPSLFLLNLFCCSDLSMLEFLQVQS